MLEKVLLIKVNQPPLDKYNFFQQAQCKARLKQKAPMTHEACVEEPTTQWQVYTRQSPRKETPQWRAKPEVPRTSSTPNRQLAIEAVQSERAELAPGSETEVVASVMLLAGSSSDAPQANTTEKWTEVVDKVVEGGCFEKEKEKEVSAIEGGTLVCMEVGGCGSGPDCFVIEARQFVALSEHAVGVTGKLGVCSELADIIVGGALTPVAAAQSVAITVGRTDMTQHEKEHVEERLGNGVPGGDVEEPQLSGQMGVILSMGHP
jgi:hypothetical protein